MANVFALLGLRALFVLVEGLVSRFRYLDETIAVILALVAVKLLLDDVYEFPPEASLAVVLGFLAGGIVLSVIAERRETRRGGRPPGPEASAARLTPREDT
jgi:tellurite resistance protein TerC